MNDLQRMLQSHLDNYLQLSVEECRKESRKLLAPSEDTWPEYDSYYLPSERGMFLMAAGLPTDSVNKLQPFGAWSDSAKARLKIAKANFNTWVGERLV